MENKCPFCKNTNSTGDIEYKMQCGCSYHTSCAISFFYENNLKNTHKSVCMGCNTEIVRYENDFWEEILDKCYTCKTCNKYISTDEFVNKNATIVTLEPEKYKYYSVHNKCIKNNESQILQLPKDDCFHVCY